MINDLFSPLNTIKHEKKTKSIQNQIITLTIASILFAIATIILIIKINSPVNIIIAAITSTMTYFILAPIGALIYYIILKSMTGKGKYKDSLVSVVQTALIISTGLLITSLAILLPQIGYMLGLITLLFTIMIALAIFIRAMIELTGANTVQIITMLIIFALSLIIAVQLMAIVQLMSTPITQNLGALPSETFAMNMSK
ncbi:MAG: hypothetical protein ACLFN8_03830 [Candidatus Woesearchaeota archaeon]